MSKAAQKILATFESLPEEDKHSVVVELLRRTASDTYPALDHESLVASAEDVFLELDRLEEAT